MWFRPLSLLLILIVVAPAEAAEPWRRHTIDNSSRGADGVRVADINGDGLPDLTTGWEEGGRVRVYLHPGFDKAHDPWPSVTVGKVKSPEDAVFIDLNQDGAVDVVSSCEGRQRTMFVHWAPGAREHMLDAKAWRTEPIPCTENQQLWMFATPIRLRGRSGTDLVVGSKGGNASVGLLLSDPRGVAHFRYRRLVDAGWIMSITLHDVDNDGDGDIVYSDRKGSRRAIWWLENPGKAPASDAWRPHQVGGTGMEVMFLDVADWDQDGRKEIVTATRNGVILIHSPPDDPRAPWSESRIDNPLSVPNGKAVRVVDVDGDGKPDLVHSCNNGGKRQFEGVTWLKGDGLVESARSISGRQGVKFDLIQTLDLDGDGDLDLVTCEERDNLGVIWYENPHAGN